MKILREEVKNDVPSSGGLTDLFDGAIYTLYNITSDELDVICEKATDDELDLFVSSMGTMEVNATYSQMRKGLEVRNKYVEYYKQK
jgi:hypothetical protein